MAAADDARDPVKLSLARARAILFKVEYPLPCPLFDQHGLLPVKCQICNDKPDSIDRGHPSELVALEHAVARAQEVARRDRTV